MNLNIEELAKTRLQRAMETLEEARLMAKNDHWNGCVNRLYYASFYAVMALLTKYGYQSSTHKGAKTLFSQHFILTGEISGRSGKTFSQMFTLRQFGDYDDFFAVEVEKIEDYFREVELLIAEIKEKVLR